MSQHNINTTLESLEFQTPGWILNLLVVLPENVYVIWLIVTGAGNGVAAEFFSLNLSVCEIFLCLQSLLSLLNRASPSLLQAAGYLLGIPITGRPLFQCLICVECYLAVVHPVTFLKYKRLRYKVICCTAAWTIIAFACVIVNASVFQMYLFVCFSLCQALLTLSIKLFCCLAVLRALKQSGPGERLNKDKTQEDHVKRRAFHFIVMIIMAMLLIYSAYLMAALIYILIRQFIPTLWSIGQVCFVLGGLVQPLLYLYRTGNLPFCKVP